MSEEQASLTRSFREAHKAGRVNDMRQAYNAPGFLDEVMSSAEADASKLVDDCFRAFIAKAGDNRTTLSYTKDTHDAIFATVKTALAAALGARTLAHSALLIHKARLDAMEERIASLEKAPLAYCGTHESTKTYQKGSFVTQDGSLWHANYTTASRPGDGSGAWTLAVKRGKDGKDAR